MSVLLGASLYVLGTMGKSNQRSQENYRLPFPPDLCLIIGVFVQVRQRSIRMLDLLLLLYLLARLLT